MDADADKDEDEDDADNDADNDDDDDGESSSVAKHLNLSAAALLQSRSDWLDLSSSFWSRDFPPQQVHHPTQSRNGTFSVCLFVLCHCCLRQVTTFVALLRIYSCMFQLTAGLEIRLRVWREQRPTIVTVPAATQCKLALRSESGC